MTRRIMLATVLAACAGTVFGATKTYKYRCPKCRLIQEYGVPGVKKCPNDGRTMIPTK
jgi:hypothetical protein